MPSKTRDRSSLYLLSALALGAGGQFLLAQREVPWTLWPGLLLLVFAGLLFVLLPAPLRPAPTDGISVSREIGAFGLIFLIALGMRVYRLDQFPAGIYYDESCLGWGALTILREGWRPFYQIFHLSNWDIPLYYLMALWFKFVPPTQVHFFLFSVVFSLATLPLAYWTFRQLEGPRTALVGLFVLAVMRWEMTFSRNGHPAFEMLFYMMGTLAFLLHGLRTGKAWAFGISAVFFAAGFYAYAAYRAFPLLVLFLLLYETRWNPEKPKVRWDSLLVLGLPALLLSAPIWFYWLKNGFLSWREKEVFIFPRLVESGSLAPLFSHLMDFILMFNRQGDPWHLHNLPGHRMLDDVTGILLVLGFFLASFRWRERKYFYPLAGFCFMGLPAFLSNEAANAGRAFGTVPFAALLAAVALDPVWVRFRSLEKTIVYRPLSALLFVGLGSMLALNFKTYFLEQAVDYSCWRGADTDKTIVGRAVAQQGDRYEYYLSPFFDRHYTVVFLGFSQKEHIHPLDLAEGLSLAGQPSGRGAFFALEEGQKGVLQLLQWLYPGGETSAAKNPQGHSIVYFYQVPPAAVAGGRKKAEEFLRSDFGLKGTYRVSPDPRSGPATIHRDPLLNFTSKEDFPLNGGLPFVRWEGSLVAPMAGTYFFLGLASDPSSLSIDGKPMALAANEPSAGCALARGPHRIVLDFQNTSNFSPVFSFLWKKPGEENFEVVPASAFHSPGSKAFNARFKGGIFAK